MTDLSWRRDAACRHEEPELFFPGEKTLDPHVWDAPRAVCEACPVRDACLEYALDAGEPHGMFGGLTPEERHKIRRPGPRERRTARLLVCGTEAGYRRHHRRKERVCDACREAANSAQRDRLKRRNAG